MSSLILIVDDVPCNLDYVEEIIEDDSIDVLKTTNGKEAIDIAKKHKPDLILLDVAMPEMNGYEVCKILKSDKELKGTPIIFLTARVQEEDIIKGFEAGAVDYIIKPFNFRELLSRVNTHLELKQKTEELMNINLKLEELVNQRTAELSQTNDELKTAYHELTRLDYAKNEFITHINHELRTPLNGILGYTSLLEEIIDSKYHEDYLRPIQNITKRLIKVAELSLLITELKTHNNAIDKKKINIIPAINKAIDCVEFAEKNLVIKLSPDVDKAYAIAESSLLSTCIRIILENAIKYSPELSEIIIEIIEENESTVINIMDNGPGFSNKALESLFTIFEADNLDHKSHGFGLGLATALKIIDILDGSIKAKNRSEGGASVTIKLLNFQ